MRTIPLRDALADFQLLGGALPGESWKRWRVLLIALMGEALRDDERVLFRELTGREREPGQRVDEFAAVIGRRGGKSRAMATLAAYISGLCEHPLVRGEKGICLCIAPDQRQASIVLDYAAAMFEGSPVLKQLIASRTSDTLELTNGVSIEVRAASFRRLRGPSFVCVIADEAAFWHSEESSNPDFEIVNACRPGLATTGGPLVIASSPYARRGLLFELYKRHYGPNGDPLILVAQGASRVLHPTLSEAVVARAYERDAASAAAEYGAQFRTDIEQFIAREHVELCIEAGVFERPPVNGPRYFSFTDPSGGSSDSMVCAVGHLDGDVLVVDGLREIRAPFDPESAVEEVAQLLALYRVKMTNGDRYSGQWCAQSFEKRSIRYEHAEQNTSQLYLELLPRINAQTIRLLDHPRSINQICALERRTSRGARDIVGHPVGHHHHDDLANAIAGLCGCTRPKYRYDTTLAWVNGPSPAEAAAKKAETDFLEARMRAHVRAHAGGPRFF